MQIEGRESPVTCQGDDEGLGNCKDSLNVRAYHLLRLTSELV